MNYKEHKIYLLQTNFKYNDGAPVYKIGRTAQKGFTRFADYPQDYKFICARRCIDSIQIEKQTLNVFRRKYVASLKNEYFSGNVNDMIKDINKIIDDEQTQYLKENKKSIQKEEKPEIKYQSQDAPTTATENPPTTATENPPTTATENPLIAACNNIFGKMSNVNDQSQKYQVKLNQDRERSARYYATNKAKVAERRKQDRIAIKALKLAAATGRDC